MTDVQKHDQKRTVFVGGIGEEVDEKVLHAAFIPFGNIVEVQIPAAPAGRGAQQNQKHRGFGFVIFEEIGDAAAAIDNMNDAELFGRVLRVNLSKPIKGKLGASKSVWAQAEDWANKLESGADADTPSSAATAQLSVTMSS
eukprot:g2279.t1